MRYLSTFIGSAIVGMWVFGIWGTMWNTYGIFGGWISGFIIISTMWYLNHYVGVIYNAPDAAWVDMGLAVGAAGTVVTALGGASVAASIPTLALVLIGGALGGIAGTMVNNHLAEEAKKD